MRSSRNAACLSVLILWMLLSSACTRTRTLTKIVEVPKVTTKVVEVDRCPTTLPEIPAIPPRRAAGDAAAACAKAFGEGAICYPPIDATRLGLLLDALGTLYRARLACEHGTHVGNQQAKPVEAPPVVP